MKKTSIKLTFAAVAAMAGTVAGLGGCHNNTTEPQPDVYGPPEWFNEKEEEEPQQTDYGPPEWFDGKDDEPINTVYGPPEWFEGEDDPQPDVYGPPEWFEGEDEPQQLVYGPPEWFDDVSGNDENGEAGEESGKKDGEDITDVI